MLKRVGHERSVARQVLVLQLVVVHAREVVEAVDDARWSAMASVLAHRK